MRLKAIDEGFMSQKIREALRGDNELGYTSRLPPPASGHDSGSRVTGNTSLPTGVPTNPRHRKYFGMETKPIENV